MSTSLIKPSEILEEKEVLETKCLALVRARYCKVPRQCHNKKKGDSIYCGIHLKAKKVTRFDHYFQKQVVVPPGLKIKVIDQENVENAFPSLTEIKKWKIKDIREHIQNRGIDISLKQSKSDLCQRLSKHYAMLNKYSPHLKKLIKAQAVVRGFLCRLRSRCVNQEDIYTLDSIYSVPTRYFFYFQDIDGFYYGFDIRSFKKMIDNSVQKDPVNPYNWKPISPGNLIKYKTRLVELICTPLGLEEVQDIEYKVTAETELEKYMIAVFHKFDMLDNYTDHRWFKNLSMFQLKKLYKECEDIWNYRANLTMAAKKILVHHGIAFTQSVSKIMGMPSNDKSKMKLQKIILREFERFVDEGATLGDRKTGAKLMLTGLVTVSDAAANAYPYLQWALVDSN